MKSIKALALVVSPMLMAMAFLGVPTAMGETTSSCKTDENPCAAANQVTHEHETIARRVRILPSGEVVIECNVLVLRTRTTALASPLVSSGSFTYTNCTQGSSSCTVSEENGPSEFKLLKEGHETGSLTFEWLAHVVCSGLLDCSFNGTGLKATVKGPLLSAEANGEVVISEQALTKETGGFLCPKTAKLDLAVTPLSATYISS